MSPDDNEKMREKETSERKRLGDGISCDGINKMRRREINDFECMKEAKNIYTGLKVMTIPTSINPSYVSSAIDLLLEP